EQVRLPERLAAVRGDLAEHGAGRQPAPREVHGLPAPAVGPDPPAVRRERHPRLLRPRVPPAGRLRHLDALDREAGHSDRTARRRNSSRATIAAVSWEDEVAELRRREELAKQMGGEEKVARQHAAGRLTVRERIDELLDPGSFHEVGALAGKAEYDESGRLQS